MSDTSSESEANGDTGVHPMLVDVHVKDRLPQGGLLCTSLVHYVLFAAFVLFTSRVLEHHIRRSFVFYAAAMAHVQSSDPLTGTPIEVPKVGIERAAARV